MNFSDPVLWGCVIGFIVLFVGFIWGIGRFRSKKTDDNDALLSSLSASDDSPMTSLDLGGPPMDKPTPKKESVFTPTPAPASPAVPSSVLTSAFSKEISDRLGSMTSHLAEMQTVLTKQAGQAGSPSAAPTGVLGQGMSPETIDKLLKIIGNVVQQVDVLQKSLNVGGGAAAAVPKPTNVPSGSVFVAPPSSASAPKINPPPNA